MNIDLAKRTRDLVTGRAEPADIGLLVFGAGIACAALGGAFGYASTRELKSALEILSLSGFLASAFTAAVGSVQRYRHTRHHRSLKHDLGINHPRQSWIPFPGRKKKTGISTEDLGLKRPANDMGEPPARITARPEDLSPNNKPERPPEQQVTRKQLFRRQRRRR